MTTLKKKLIIGGVALSLSTIIMIIVIISVVAGLVMTIIGKAKLDSEASGGIDEIIAIEINGAYDGKNGKLHMTGDGIDIDNIKGTGNATSFTAKNSSKGKNSTTNLPTPKSSAAKLTNGMSYMARLVQSNYDMHLWQGYPGYKLANNKVPGKKITKDGDGMARCNGTDYLIALGSAYHNGDKDVGKQRYKVTVKKGNQLKSFTAILGDTKKDEDTDSTHRFHTSDGSVVEMHVWSYSTKFKNPNVLFPGTLVKLEKIGGQVANLKISIKGSKVVIAGDVDGTKLETEGTYIDGKIRTSGYLGDFSGGGSGVQGMVNFIVKIAKDNSHGYSQPNRQCNICHKGANGDYDCSSLVTAAIAHGMGNKTFLQACENWAYSTSNMGPALKKAGFKNLGYGVARSKLKAGDVMLNPSAHVEMVVSNKNGQVMTAGAHGDENHGISGPRPGDQTGNEISVVPIYLNTGAYQCWRYVGK